MFGLLERLKAIMFLIAFRQDGMGRLCECTERVSNTRITPKRGVRAASNTLAVVRYMFLCVIDNESAACWADV